MKIGRKDFKNTMKYGIKFNNRLKILGIVFSNECETIEIGENIDSRIEKLERICCLWQKRYLTLIGKITVLKSFGLSIFIYLMQSIGISEEKLKKINGILFRFIWNKKMKNENKVTEKIKRDVMNKNYADGGLNMIDIFKFQDSFLLKWADRLLGDNRDSWRDCPLYFFQKVGLHSFHCNISASNFKGLDLI